MPDATTIRKGRMLALWTAMATAAGLNLPLVLLGRGSFLQGMAVTALVVLLAAPAALIGGVALLSCYLGRSSWERGVAQGALGLAAVLGSTVASIPAGLAVHQVDVRDAKGYCEGLIPRLEEFRRGHGSYPTDLSQLGRLPPPPLLLRGETFYHSNGDEYDFDFLDPAGMFNGYHYDGEAGQWHRWD